MPEGFSVQERLDEPLNGDTGTAFNAFVPGILLLVAIGGAIDLALDRPQRWLSAHVIIEVALMITSLTFSIILWRALRVSEKRLVSARHDVVRRTEERDAWKKSADAALAGFSIAVQQQFARWNLTPVEREVALLLLQGHGHKQIAGRTNRSERTVRQHAVSIYEKSGLGGRAELAAFFLEGLMLNDNKQES
jgi:DNA-binding CsgD family transcriptional regulator